MSEKLILWWNLHRPSKRRLIQLYSALLYNAHLKGFITGEIYKGKLKSFCVPGFNCYSCPGAIGACPLGSLQASLASSDKQIGFYIFGIFLLYGLIAGRTICGWFCPLGLIQELLHKIPTPKIKKSRVTRALSYLKYIFLAVFVFAVTLWYGLKHSMALPGFCKYICPAGTFEGAVGLLSNPNNTGYFGMLGVLFTRKFIIMLLIGGICVFCYRAFCRFICPLGAIYGMFNRLSLIGVRVDPGKCNGCGACVRNCKMDVRRVGDHECIHCGHCMENCMQGAISIKAGDFTLKPSPKDEKVEEKEITEKRRKIEKYVWTAALVLLALILIWVNFIDPSGRKKKKNTVKENTNVSSGIDKESSDDIWSMDIKDNSVQEGTDEYFDDLNDEEASDPYESDAPTGFNVGQQLEDFTAQCFDGSTFNLHEKRGKVVIINLWATWCGPCVAELPHFNEFYDKHKDDCAVLACHSPNVTDDVEEFLSSKGWDMPFTLDDEENGIFEKTNGSGVLPQTIVLNRRGEVTYNEIRSVTPEMLEQLYEEAAKEVPGALSNTGNSGKKSEEDTAKTDDNGAKEDTAVSAEEKESAELADKEKEPSEAENKEPEVSYTEADNEGFGYKKGDKLKDFTVTCIDGTDFSLSKNIGKPVLIYLWASYSKDSTDALSLYNDFYNAHSDDISAIAVHNHFGSGNMESFSKGLDIPVALDNSEEEVYKLTGASTAVPRVVILDEDGKVIYNERGNLTKEELEEFIK